MEPGAELTAAMSGLAVAQCGEFKPQGINQIIVNYRNNSKIIVNNSCIEPLFF